MKRFLIAAVVGFVILTACDGPDQTKIYPYPAPGPASPHPTGTQPPPPAPGDTFAAVQAPLIQKWCASCHQGDAFLTSGDAFTRKNNGQGPQERVGNKSMPIAGSAQAASMPQSDRDTLTGYRSLTK